MKLCLSRSLSLALIALPLSLSLAACAVDTDDEEEPVGVTDDALKQGGCSSSQIKSAQSQCRSECKSKGQISRGIKYCYAIPAGDDPDFKAQAAYSCACAKK